MTAMKITEGEQETKFKSFPEYANDFWVAHEAFGFNATTTQFYFYLLHKFNASRWRFFEVRIKTTSITEYLSMDKKTVAKVRESLLEAGLIDYYSEGKKGSQRYSLIPNFFEKYKEIQQEQEQKQVDKTANKGNESPYNPNKRPLKDPYKTHIRPLKDPDKGNESPYQEITPISILSKDKISKDKRGGEVEFPYDSEIFEQLWQLWKKYKKEEHKFRYKSKVSEQAALKQLAKLAKDEAEALAIIEQSIQNGWKGFFALKPADKTQAKNNSHENPFQYTSPEEIKAVHDYYDQQFPD